VWHLPELWSSPVPESRCTFAAESLSPRAFQAEWGILVWDWKTGNLVRVPRVRWLPFLTSPPQVLELSSTDGSELVGRDTKVTFLDEFRMMVSTPDRNEDIAELVLFNTLLSQAHPMNL